MPRRRPARCGSWYPHGFRKSLRKAVPGNIWKSNCGESVREHKTLQRLEARATGAARAAAVNQLLGQITNCINADAETEGAFS